MNKFNIVGIFLFLPILCSKSRKIEVTRSSREGEGLNEILFSSGEAVNSTDEENGKRYARNKPSDPGDSSPIYFYHTTSHLYSEVLPYLNVLKSDDGKLRLKGSFFNEDYSEKKSVPENIVKIRRNEKERWNRRTLHRRRMKKKIQRVSNGNTKLVSLDFYFILKNFGWDSHCFKKHF